MNPPIPRVLIVDDDTSWQEILAEILTDLGLEVDRAGTLEAAREAIRRAPHRLAVVDLSLESSDYDNKEGLQVLEAIRAADPGCTPVLLTGFATVELAVSVMADYKAFSCLRKEAFSRSQFKELVRKALAAARPIDEPESAIRPTGPAAGAPATGAAASPANARPASGKVLVADDDAGWRSILSEILGGAGFAVDDCCCFGEALGKLRRGKYNLAVIDLSLGPAPSIDASLSQMEGLRLLGITRTARIPTIVLSGIASPDSIEQTYDQHGVFAFLEKQSFNRQSFLRTVQEALSGPAPATPAGLDQLTDREWEVLELLAEGQTNKEIAEKLVITTNTVKRHLKSIFEKLDIHTRAAAAAKVVKR